MTMRRNAEASQLIAPGVPKRLGAALGDVLAPFWCPFRAPTSHFGAIREPFWVHFGTPGAILGPFWGPLGTPGAHLGS